MVRPPFNGSRYKTVFGVLALLSIRISLFGFGHVNTQNLWPGEARIFRCISPSRFHKYCVSVCLCVCLSPILIHNLKNDPDWSGMIRTGQDGSGLVKNDQDWSGMIRTDQE